jgi:FtsH-binding integral membrane protein
MYTFLTVGSTTALVASVVSAFGDNIDAVFVITALAVAIPLVFYIAHLVRGLFPGSRGGRR